MARYGFLRDVAVLGSGKVVAAGIRIVLIPVIARLYRPDEYGIAALFLSVTMVLVPVGILSFPQAIVLPENEEDAAGLAILSCLALLIFSALLWLCMVATQILGLEPLPRLGAWLWLVPASVVLQGMVMTMSNWLTRQRSFSTEVMADVVQSLSTGGIRLLSGLLWGSQVWPLIASLFAGQGLRLLACYRSIGRHQRLAGAVRPERLGRLLREYRQFPLYNTPAALVFALNGQLPILVFPWLFSAATVGRLAMVQALLVMALTTIGEGIRRAYLHRSARQGMTTRALRNDFLRMTVLLLVAGVGPALLLLLGAEPLFVALLGEKWQGTGAYAAAMTPWFLTQWIALPAMALTITLRMQRFWLHFQILTLLSMALGLVIGYLISATPVSVLSGLSSTRAMTNLFLIGRVGWNLKKRRTLTSEGMAS